LKPPPFAYFSPTRIEEVLRLLETLENVKLLAGGQSLMPMLNLRFVLPDQIIDLNGIDELAFIREQENKIIIGAMTRQRSMERSELLARKLPLVAKALRHVGHIQTRNRGTVGGSLCQLDPSAELLAVARAHDALIECVSAEGRRTVPVADFAASFMAPAIKQNELVSAVSIIPWTGRCGYGFHEFSRRHGDFALAGGIALLQVDDVDRIVRASLTAFGISYAPTRLDLGERMLLGEIPSERLFARVADSCKGLATLNDAFATSEYRNDVARAMVFRALLAAAHDAKSVRRLK